MRFKTLTEACRAWVNEFNAIPQSVIEKLQCLNEWDITEVTPPSVYNRVYVNAGKWANEYGEILKTDFRGKNNCLIHFDFGENHIVKEEDLEVQREYALPIWGIMWTFGDNIDNDWLEGAFSEDGMQLMADCGFRIYKSEDFGYVFGINGGGYDFYESHWCPLYKARGLKWHIHDDTKKKTA